MSKALVLGGGGPVGIGWEAGLLTGLEASGVRLADADLIVGTSAGSVVGAHVKLDSDVEDLVRHGIRALDPDAATEEAMAKGLEGLMGAIATALASPGSPDEARTHLGQFALAAQTAPEADYVTLFDALAGARWPDGFCCTAVDAHSGEFVVWNQEAGVELQRAVASSCSVPGIFPPVIIDGHTYIDGGIRTALNADVAAGHDDVVVISVMALQVPEGMSDPLLERLNALREEEFAVLQKAGAKVEVIEPNQEFLQISGWGMHLMDFNRTVSAYEAGIRQAAEELERIRARWSPAA